MKPELGKTYKRTNYSGHLNYKVRPLYLGVSAFFAQFINENGHISEGSISYDYFEGVEV